jgi:sensor domain CHASE-containing protein
MEKSEITKNKVESYNRLVSVINKTVPKIKSYVEDFENQNVTIKNGSTLSKKFRAGIREILNSIQEKIVAYIDYNGYTVDIIFDDYYKDSLSGYSQIRQYAFICCCYFSGKYYIHNIKKFEPLKKIKASTVIATNDKLKKLAKKYSEEKTKAKKKLPFVLLED